MADEITAACLCGEARLICGRSLGTRSYCRCTDCRESTGAAFSVAIPFEADLPSYLRGKT
ncbi:GFA family protein [Rhabdonatronobacter sediminivivens]